MIAKIIVHGPTRATALSQLGRVLAETEVAGTITNLAFLGALARNRDFTSGDVDTGLIDRAFDDLVTEPPPDRRTLALAAIAAAGLLDGEDADAGFTLWSPLIRRERFGDESASLTVLAPNHIRVETSLGECDCRLQEGNWRIDGAGAGRAIRHGRAVTVFAADAIREFALHDPLEYDSIEADGDLVTRAPMPGLVREVFVAAGDKVDKGDRIAVLEAMKMEHTLLAGRAGSVAEVLVFTGLQVEAGAALVRLDEEGATMSAGTAKE